MQDFLKDYNSLEVHPLPQLIDYYKSKFPDSTDFLVYKSLTYFDDAEIEPMSKMAIPINWDEVKAKIFQVVKNHFP